jgi:hypothetical protein
MSAAEYKRLQSMVKATGLKAPELFRRALFSRMDLERPLFTPEQAKNFEAELRRQGNNVNQIAKQLNAGLMNGWSQSLNSLVRAYVDLRHMLTVNRADR